MNESVRVLEKKNTFLDPITGEVKIEEQSVLLKSKRREKFMLVYVENFSMVVDLRKKTQEILAMILANKVTYGTNEVVLDSVFRSRLANELNTTRQVINNCISELVNKKIFQRQKLKGGYQYHLNPYLFGQGEWNTIERQRQQFTFDYDFVNYKASKDIKTVTQYEGLPNAKDIQVLALEKYENDNVMVEQALIKERESSEEFEADSDSKIDVSDNKIIENNSERLRLEILREENRAKELEIERLKIEIENLKLHKSGIQQQVLPFV
ncbi:hypothetical protein BKH41_08915 [Helicobacter sp. 12S02232-10]|uniref:hypothetical protein n=1 Tax=Helicobacter sp. 12S02232-10 TaxID=1476197 RepID=UPI000BA78AC4|nr:hypothetical protein [Helicobacter sp. 12S02232-10]PAF46615.1 hypothetical protein BKH41_08915 [Helicobacter sp. 12S02232-10]